MNPLTQQIDLARRQLLAALAYAAQYPATPTTTATVLRDLAAAVLATTHALDDAA
jgi:hypothetical protein